MKDEFYSVSDIQEKLKIGRNAAYKLVSTKGFPAIRLGNTIRVPADKFDQWVNTYSGKTFYM